MFVNRIFIDCDVEESGRWVHVVRCYSENNGSITKTAEDLYIHKNRLQYGLCILLEASGYDP